ncbi:MAG: Trp family transcriptional regulator [Patescibacteria group bacterium]|nr:trp operon repressor [Patescibacteria group bacterium]
MLKLRKQLVEHLLGIKTPKQMEDFLKAILTPAELDSIPTRLEIVRMLKKGVSQREIAKKLGVGIATVTRGSIELKLNHFKDV